MFKIAATTLLLSLIAAPAYSQTPYTYAAPIPGQLPSSDSSEVLSSDQTATVYGASDFIYSVTPDSNIFVTRIFIGDIGDNNSIGTSVQIDCGRGMFRHLVQPRLFNGSNSPGTPIDMAVNQWLVLDRSSAVGRSMMMSCESAAQQEGIIWSWY
jgi:hypothetical protein